MGPVDIVGLAKAMAALRDVEKNINTYVEERWKQLEVNTSGLTFDSFELTDSEDIAIVNFRNGNSHNDYLHYPIECFNVADVEEAKEVLRKHREENPDDNPVKSAQSEYWSGNHIWTT